MNICFFISSRVTYCSNHRALQIALVLVAYEAENEAESGHETERRIRHALVFWPNPESGYKNGVKALQVRTHGTLPSKLESKHTYRAPRKSLSR